jgi:hypothetical protein
VGVPALAQRLEAAPSVVGLERDAEEVAHLAVEVGDVALGVGQRAHGHVAQLCEPLGQQPQRHALARPGLAADQRKAAFAHQALLDAPAEALDPGGGAQGLGRQVRGEGIPLEAVEREQLLVHDEDSSGSCGFGR